VSRQAIAAALAREDLTGGERLVAFSLASFAGRDDRAWPGAPAAAARAGLSRSRYLYDRDRLAQRGLVVVEKAASGRGRASTLALPFVSQGPWWDGEINAELFEAGLSRSRARGPARLVLAAMAALADGSGIVRGLSGVKQISTNGFEGNDKTRALLKNGTVQYFTYNSKQKAPLPTTVAGISGANFIATGASTDCAVLAAGTVKCWNDDGTTATTPVLVSGL